jgi:hypothetical protein
MHEREMTRLLYRAYIRDGDREISGEALLLALLMHTRGTSRKSQDMRQVQKMMRDINLDKTTKERG